MQDSQIEIDQLIELLSATPSQISAVTESLDPALLVQKPDEESWSLNEILAHLGACADVWGKSIHRMITQDHPTIRYVSPRTWIRKKDYPGLAFQSNLEAFIKQREELLILLKEISLDGWSRGATFTGTTRGRDGTVLSYVNRLTDHEDAHLHQIDDLVGTMKT